MARETQSKRARLLDGAVSTHVIADLANADYPMSFGGWVKCALNYEAPFALTQRGGTQTYFCPRLDVNGEMRVYRRNPTENFTRGGAGLLTANQWNHIFIVLENATSVKSYVNGVLDINSSSEVSVPMSPQVDATLVGQARETGLMSYTGNAGDLLICNAVIDPATIAQLADREAAIEAIVNLHRQRVVAAHYKLDETHPSICYDSSAAKAHGAISGGVTADPGCGAPYSWPNAVGYADGDVHYKTAPVGWGNGNAVYPACTKIAYIVESTNNSQSIALDTSSSVVSRATADYFVQCSTTQADIWESNNSAGNFAVSVGDEVSIEIIDGTVYYKKNGTTQYTSLVTPSGTYYGHAMVYATLSYFGPIKIDGNWSYADTTTGTTQTELIIPRDESNQTFDVLGNPLEYRGPIAGADAILANALDWYKLNETSGSTIYNCGTAGSDGDLDWTNNNGQVQAVDGGANGTNVAQDAPPATFRTTSLQGDVSGIDPNARYCEAKRAYNNPGHGGTAFSVFTWWNRQTNDLVANRRTLLANYDIVGNNRGWMLNLLPASEGGKLNAVISSNGTDFALVDGVQNIREASFVIWQHTGFTFDNGILQFWINGEKEGDPQDTGLSQINAPAGRGLNLYNWSGQGSTDRWMGRQSDIGIWNRVLTDDEINTLFTNPPPPVGVAAGEALRAAAYFYVRPPRGQLR